MLKDGQFIKEPPVKIGVNYIPPIHRPYSAEEQFIQDIILNQKCEKQTTVIVETCIGLVAVYAIGWMIATVARTILEVLIG